MNAAATGLFHALGAYQGPVAEPWVRLLDQLRIYQDTAFGRTHDFAGIRSEADFRERVPVMDGDDYAPWIARAAPASRIRAHFRQRLGRQVDPDH